MMFIKINITNKDTDYKNVARKWFYCLHTYFNIIYSLFRTENLENAEEMFVVFQEKVPLYIKISKEVIKTLLTFTSCSFK